MTSSVTTGGERRLVTRLGLQISGYSNAGTADVEIFSRITEVAQRAELAGFDSLWTMDHVHQIETVGDRTEPILEAYTTLAALAPVTGSVKLGVLATACGFRNPALLAKMVTTIDVISRGRAVLGIGAGWHAEEYAAYGFEFPPAGERLDQLSEAVHICRSMFTEDAPSFAGKHFTIAGALNSPAPIRRGGPPILIGGGGERRTIPLAAEYADACNFFGAPATVRHKISVLERSCEAIGRDPAEITKTWLGHVIVADSERELQDQLDLLGRRFRQDPRAARGFALCGTEEEVVAQRDSYLAIGVDGLIVTMLDPLDADHVERAGRLLGPASSR